MFKFRKMGSAKAELMRELAAIKERSDLLDDACGVGLWEAVLHNADALHPKSLWTWSPEFRRLLGYEHEADYPNVVQSWSDRLHPDDVEPTFAAFGGHLTDKSGRSRYDVTYRLKVRDGSYRWFRATGGCRYSADGTTIRACGSLTDIHTQKMAELAAAKEAEDDQLVIRELAAGLAALAAGDLTHQIIADLPSKAEVLKRDFNATASQLRDTVATVVSTTATLRSGTADIAQASDDLAQRTERQAASLQETSSALNEITTTVHRTAEGAAQAATVAGQARQDAEHSGSVVENAVTAMGEIERSSKQIGQIIGVIDEIAFQTNLLALNAGVEAARAGDAGRGFAVVASEVRALAQRSADAAKEIKSLVSASSQQVAQGVKLVADTGQALNRIMAQVGQIDTTIAAIAGSAKEQAAGLAEVNTAVRQMDQMTQQNASMVEQSTGASRALSGKADELANLTAQFRVGEQSFELPAPAATRPVVGHAPRPAARKGRRPVAAATVPLTSGNTALKAAPADDWQEF